MSLVAVLRGRPAVAAALLCALAPRPSLAQTGVSANGTPPVATAAAPATGTLRVWVDAQGVPLDVAALRASLSKELGREVELTSDPASAHVLIRLESEARATVRYTTPSGQRLTRDVELPPDRERSLQVLSWLTVNLVRDEASELLDELRARRKAEADARAAEEQVALAKAAQDKAAADKLAADKAAAVAARKSAAATAAKAKRAPRDELIRDRFKSFDVALATPISLLRDSPKRELRFQLALAYGESGAIRGAAASPGVLRIRQDLDGAAMALAFAMVSGDARGAVGSLGYARVEGRLDGASLGLGIASAHSLRGAMVSGGITLLSDPSHAILLAGGINVAGDLTGIELAGGINVARDFRGIALAPVNVQRRVRGLQIGIVNVADQVDGAAIGIISVARNGRVQPVVWGGTDGAAHLALKSIAGLAFTQFGGGVALNGDEISYDAGIGAHLRASRSFFIEPGLHYSSTHATNGTTGTTGTPDRSYLHYLVMCGLRIGDMLDFLAGGGVRHTVEGASGDKALVPEVRAGIGFF